MNKKMIDWFALFWIILAIMLIIIGFYELYLTYINFSLNKAKEFFFALMPVIFGAMMWILYHLNKVVVNIEFTNSYVKAKRMFSVVQMNYEEMMDILVIGSSKKRYVVFSKFSVSRSMKKALVYQKINSNFIKIKLDDEIEQYLNVVLPSKLRELFVYECKQYQI